mmetsp:Transcript_34593/g.78175  ORF Transcript_34593/g.78175 Transcript_34593/m.78175 type:complete len:102 (-) Transcript_34593:415-720(-)
MLQLVALAVYVGAQKLTQDPTVLGGLLPKAVIEWLPALSALLAFVILSQYQKWTSSKATAKLIGQEAPDMELEFPKEGRKMLRALVLEKKLPTVVDFYQNF